MTRIVLCAAALALAACGGAPDVRAECPEPLPAQLVIEASPRLNPDMNGNPLATELRLYQLRSADAMSTVSFEDVWQDASAALGDALLSEESLTVQPGETLRRQLRPEENAAAIAAVVIVREPAGRSWRAVVPLARPSELPESLDAPNVGNGLPNASMRPAPDVAVPVCRPPAVTRVTFRMDGYRVEAITPQG